MKGDKVLTGTLLLLGLLVTTQVAGTGVNEDLHVAGKSIIQIEKQSLSQISNYTTYGTMIINNDTDLEQIALIQGFTGNGTREHPYVITGFNFSGIHIANTRKHIIIANNSVSAPLTSIGLNSFLQLSNVSNVAIHGNIIALPGYNDTTASGIQITQSSNVTINRNSIHGVSKGVYVTYSNNTIISENWITTRSNNIHVFASTHITIRNNTLTSLDFLSMRFSILIENSAQTNILETIIENSPQGLRLVNVDRIFTNGFKMITWSSITTIPITSVEVVSANNTILSGFNLQDQRFGPNQQQPYDISRGFFIHGGYLSNFTITNSTINGMANAVEFAGNSGQDVFVKNIVITNSIKAVVVMSNNPDFTRITVSGCTFMNITDWESVRIDQQSGAPISDVRIVGNMFLTPTTYRVEIFTWNIQDVFIFRNNFFTQYGLSTGFDDGLWAFINTSNVTVAENYYQHIKAEDLNNDGYYDTYYTREGYVDSFPATMPWPSESFPILYLDAEFKKPQSYDIYYNGQVIDILWYPAADTHGTPYVYNLLWKNHDTNVEGTISEFIMDTYFLWKIQSMQRGVYSLILEIVNSSNTTVVSRIESVTFSIEEQTITTYSETHTGSSNYGDQTSSQSESIEEPTIPSLEIPVGGSDLFVIPLLTIVLAPILRRYRKDREAEAR